MLATSRVTFPGSFLAGSSASLIVSIIRYCSK